jgi:UDP-N-acetylglucosamine 1-carboxyvinyltransferase
MDSILVRGGAPLAGAIPIAGAKNACLALMPATLLSEEPLTLTNAPAPVGHQDNGPSSCQSMAAEVSRTPRGGQGARGRLATA